MIGAHIQRKPTLVATLEELRKHNGNVLQIFVGNPRSGRISEKSQQKYLDEARAVRFYIQRHNMQIWVHSAYTVNLAKDFDPNSYHIKCVLEELRIANALGASGVITHIGRNADTARGIQNMEQAVRYILQHCPRETCFVLETSSHMGSELLYDLDDLYKFFKRFDKNDNLKLCIDTAHVWAIGYDPNVALTKALKLFGANKIAVVQVNNSPKARGTRVDRHTCLQDSNSKMALKTLVSVVATSISRKIPVILETPHDCWRTEVPLLKNKSTEKVRS